MTQHFGYLVDVSGIKLDEATTSSWIQAMPLGKYKHPVYGDINIDDTRAKSFADNHAANVRGQELDIDYDHKVKTDKAAGWVKKAEARPGEGLWLLVEWTKKAYKALKEKEYKYFSPEFYDEWTHPATNTTHKNVLFGGGLTNRPYLKGILPINLSEILAGAPVPTKDEGSKGMTPEQIKKLAEKFGLAEDASEDDVMKAALDADLKSKDDKDPAKLNEPDPLAAAKKLAESNPALQQVVQLMEAQAATVKSLSEQLATNTGALRLSESINIVEGLASKAKAQGWALPPAAKTQLSEEIAKLPLSVQLSEAPVVKILSDMLDAKLVQLGELGNLHTVKKLAEDEEGKSAQEVLMARATKLTEGDKGMNFTEAWNRVVNDDPELFNDYRHETGTGQVGGAS